MIPRWPAIVVAMLTRSGCATTWLNTQLVFRSSVVAGEHLMRSGSRRWMLEKGYTQGGPWKGSSG